MPHPFDPQSRNAPDRERVPAPETTEVLLARATQLAGRYLGELAAELGIAIPPSSTRGKGWGGQLCEALLGCDAGSEAEPDFKHLGIELKTLPLSPQGKCLESTFVCSINLMALSHETWPTSRVWRKCQQVLWLPIICPEQGELGQRQLGMPLLWRPSAAEAHTLAHDWQELTTLMCCGRLSEISAHHGQVLQVRPKGANAKAVEWAVDEKGEKALTLKRGFYLRARFTQALLDRHFG